MTSGVSLSSRLKDPLGPVTRVKKKYRRNDLRVVEVLGGGGGRLDDLLQRRHHPWVRQRLRE